MCIGNVAQLLIEGLCFSSCGEEGLELLFKARKVSLQGVGLAGAGNEALSKPKSFSASGGVESTVTKCLLEGTKNIARLLIGGDDVGSLTAALKYIECKFMEGGGNSERLSCNWAVVNRDLSEALIDFSGGSAIEHKDEDFIPGIPAALNEEYGFGDDDASLAGAGASHD